MRYFLFLTMLFIGQGLNAQTGVSWSQSIAIAPNHFGNMHPRVVTDRAGNPLVIWGKSSSNRVYFSRMSGNAFTSPVLLNPDTIPVFAASWAGPDLASHGDTVYVVYKETPEDASGIYIVRSFDGGANFSAPERVDAIADSISRFPAVSTDADGKPLVAFMKFNPGWGNARHVLARSADYGVTFGADILGSGYTGGTVCDCCPATLSSSGNTTALLYRDNLNNLRNSWAGISFDGGNSFAGGFGIDDTDWMINACPASGPDGVIIGDKLYSVFMSAAGGKTLCYLSLSNLNTMELEAIEPLTGAFPGLGVQNFPRIAASGNAVAIVWQQTVNNSSQLAVQFTNNITNGFPVGYEVLWASNVTNADVTFGPNEKISVVWEDASTGTVNYKFGLYTVSGINTQTDATGSIRIFPNPAKESELNVQFDTPVDDRLNCNVFNAQGQIMRSEIGQPIEGVMKMDVSNLPGGVYVLRMNNQDQSYIRQFVIE